MDSAMMMNDVLDLTEYYEKFPHKILEHPEIGICLFYCNGKVIYSNQRFSSIHQIDLENIHELLIQEFCRYTAQNLSEFLNQLKKPVSIPAQEIYINRGYYLYKIQGFHKNNRFILLVTLIEITAFKRMELALRHVNHQFEHDLLLDRSTGLANFSAFEIKINEIIQDENQYPFSIILMNIDGFKKFNRESDFDYKDQTIKMVGECLQKNIIDESNLIFRLYDDEFILILPEIQGWSLYTLAEKIRTEIYNLNIYFNSGINHRLTMSFAIQNYQKVTDFDIDFFLVKLKKLLHIAKQQGGNCWIDGNSEISY